MHTSKVVYFYNQKIQDQINTSAKELLASYGKGFNKYRIFIYLTNGYGDNRLTITINKRFPECVEKLIKHSNRFVWIESFGYVPIVFDHDHQSTLFKNCGINMIPHGGRTIVFDDDFNITYYE